MEIKNLTKPLEIKDIDFRVQSINNGKYATILAYKDARVDMNRLDEVVGSENWQRDHKEVNGVVYCGVGISIPVDENFKKDVWKWDAGSESNTEKEKGQASDSFKRACFNWGIGRELYDYPRIVIKLNDDEVLLTGRERPKYKLSYDVNIKKWKWFSQFTENKLSFLMVKDLNDNLRFKWGKYLK